MDSNPVVVSLSSQEILKLEMICVDADKDQALSFLNDLRQKINQKVKGMQSHLDK
jgi:hypothetical protein